MACRRKHVYYLGKVEYEAINLHIKPMLTLRGLNLRVNLWIQHPDQSHGYGRPDEVGLGAAGCGASSPSSPYLTTRKSTYL